MRSVAPVPVFRRSLNPADDLGVGDGISTTDEVAVEASLAVRIAGEVVATTMRTPGHDRELALGYLYSEGAISSLADVASLAVCGRSDDPEYGNVLELTPSPGLTLEGDPLARLQRQALRTSACGVCGREQILELKQRCSPVMADSLRISTQQVAQWLSLFEREQTLFARTGGVHAAVAVEIDGGQPVGFEDVGRHNAVDKVVGHLLLHGRLPAHESVLLVTSRASFEIVQKACVARFPVLVCLSAPTSLAIEAATEFGLTLLGFVRAGGFNVYAGAQRIA